MMDKNFQIKSERLLAVEGKDEKGFFEVMLGHLGIAGQVDVVDIGGKDKFPGEMELLVRSPQFKRIRSLGLVRDAEDKVATAAFQSICSILRKHKLPLPVNPCEVIDSYLPWVGVYIMPDNAGAGMLESLCLQVVEASPRHKCVDAYIDCVKRHLPPHELANFNEPKARVQTYLAAQVPIANSVGRAAQKGHWDFDHPCLGDLKRFLLRLFGGDGGNAGT